MSAVAFLIFGLAAIIAIPIAHALVLAAIGGILWSDRVPLSLVIEQMVAQVQSFPLIAIPFFILTGALMMGGRLGQTLIDLMTTLIGRFHGGPAQVGVLSSTIFGAAPYHSPSGAPSSLTDSPDRPAYIRQPITS